MIVEAYATNEDVKIEVLDLTEEWSIEITKKDGTWDFFPSFTACGTVKRFKELAKEYGIKTVYVPDYYLDADGLAEWDRRRSSYEQQEAYREACMIHQFYGDRSALDRYEREYDE